MGFPSKSVLVLSLVGALERGGGGIFVCRLVTSIKTSITSYSSSLFFMKFIKSVVSLRFDFYCCAIG